MIKIIINKFNSMEEKIRNILRGGLKFSLFVCLLSALILIGYHYHTSPDLYYIGLSVFRLGLFFIVEFVISAFAIDTIKAGT